MQRFTDRCLTISYPLKFGQMRMKKARCIAGIGWIACTFLAILPLSKGAAFGDAYYGRTGMKLCATSKKILLSPLLGSFFLCPCAWLWCALLIVWRHHYQVAWRHCCRRVSTVYRVQSEAAWVGIFRLHLPRTEPHLLHHHLHRVESTWTCQRKQNAQFAVCSNLCWKLRRWEFPLHNYRWQHDKYITCVLRHF